MNKTEYYNGKNNRNKYYRQAQKLLKEWKTANNIAETCVIHHRDDTEECIKYNNEHYKLWGFDENGDFIEGKYVVFMTNVAHASYHHKDKILSGETKVKISATNKGENNPFYGKHHSNEIKEKLRIVNKGKKLSDETRMKISVAQNGKKCSDETKQKMSQSAKEHMQIISDAYKKYKLNGGALMWNDFRKQYNDTAIGDIQCN